MNRTPTALLVLSLLLAILAGGALWYLGTRIAPDSSETSVAGRLGGPFALVDQDGHARSSKDFRGKYVLLYFGYTYCPDVCPTTLGVMADALAKLGPKGARIVPVFITVDPERDTSSVLKKYLAAFGPQFVGLTGTLPQIKTVAKEYGIYFAKQDLDGGGYAVNHSSVVYLLSPGGQVVKFYNEAMTPDSLARDLAART